MSWFDIILGELRKLHSNLEKNMSAENFKDFYDAVGPKLETLEKESEEIGALMSNAVSIRDELDKIKHEFNQMLFMKGEIQNQGVRAQKGEVKRISESLDTITDSLKIIKKRRKSIEKVFALFKKQEKKEEK